MIGMVNMPSNSPIDFYAPSPRQGNGTLGLAFHNRRASAPPAIYWANRPYQRFSVPNLSGLTTAPKMTITTEEGMQLWDTVLFRVMLHKLEAPIFGEHNDSKAVNGNASKNAGNLLTTDSQEQHRRGRSISISLPSSNYSIATGDN